MIELNLCYIIGTSLLYVDKLSFSHLERTCKNLECRNYKVDYSINNIINVIIEWRDFFAVQGQSIILKQKAKEKIEITSGIFNQMLDDKSRADLFDSIFNMNNKFKK